MGAQAIVQIRVYQTPYNTMMMKIFALLAFVGAATALPSTADDIVPEGFDASGMAPPANFLEVSAFDEAKATVQSMIQAGKDEGACADLAAATVKEVEDSVDAAQKTLDSLNTGSDCPNKGQGAVDTAQSALDQANKDKEAADAAASAAASASVNFGSMPLSSLTEGQCGVFFNSAAYTSAVATKESTANAATQAAAAVTAAEAGLKAAQEAQQDAIKECQCSAKKAAAAAWEAANANNDANEKAYTKGKHMECVLAGTPVDSCQVGAIPKVTEVTLANGVESATCEGVDTESDYENRDPEIFQEGDNSPVPTQGVTFYKHCVSDGRYAAGYRVTIFHDTPNVGAVGMQNNDVSSIWIPHGWQVEIYDNQNYGGTVKKFDACNKDNFHVPCLVNNGFNDRMESVKMSPCGEAPAPAPPAPAPAP